MSEVEEPSAGRRATILGAAAAIIAPAMARAAQVGAEPAGLDELFQVQTGGSDRDDGRRGFDFLHGRWTVAHRNREPLDAAAPWREFTGLVDCRPLVGGLVNVDDNILRPGSGVYRAATLRVFDPAAKTWSIYWISEKGPAVDAYPVRGGFKDGVGLFYATDPTTSPVVTTRFKWWKITPVAARWEQALSTDGGGAWIDNWFMDFARAG